MPIIKTKRFTLRPFRRGDESSLVRNINNKSIARSTLRIPYPYTLKDAKEWVKKNLKEARKKKPEEINFVIDIDGEVAGSVGFKNVKKEHKAEVGYWLALRYRNKGIMTKALKLITKFGFEKLKFRRISAHVFSFNKASMKVLEKNGYKFEGILRKEIKKDNKFIDVHLFAKIN